MRGTGGLVDQVFPVMPLQGSPVGRGSRQAQRGFLAPLETRENGRPPSGTRPEPGEEGRFRCTERAFTSACPFSAVVCFDAKQFARCSFTLTGEDVAQRCALQQFLEPGKPAL
jgi:hypothetical protein